MESKKEFLDKLLKLVDRYFWCKILRNTGLEMLVEVWLRALIKFKDILCQSYYNML